MPGCTLYYLYLLIDLALDAHNKMSLFLEKHELVTALACLLYYIALWRLIWPWEATPCFKSTNNEHLYEHTVSINNTSLTKFMKKTTLYMLNILNFCIYRNQYKLLLYQLQKLPPKNNINHFQLLCETIQTLYMLPVLFLPLPAQLRGAKPFF